MKNKYDFFIAGRARNKEKILDICEIFEQLEASYYCFLKNEESYNSYGKIDQTPEEKQAQFEKLELKSSEVLKVFNEDLEAEKSSDKFILVLPAGKSGHIEAGIAYGLGKKCYAVGEYDATDSLYNIFEKIFKDKYEMKKYFEEEK